MVQIKHEEQYSLITPTNLNDMASFTEIEKEVVNSLEAGHRNFVVNLEGIHLLSGDSVHHFAALKNIIDKEDGRLVIACPPANLEEALEENDIVGTPTLNEATDYIFMEEIEKQLMEDVGEEGMDEEE
jgi:hypothetical protein